MKVLYMIYFTNIILLFLLYKLTKLGCYCKANNIPLNYRFTISIPMEYNEGFNGRAYVMETNQMPLNFRTAVSVDADQGRYSCTLQVFLGSVMVWSSGHHLRFYTLDVCVLELNEFGDLRLKGYNGQIGWRTATSGQGVQKLQLLDNGNLVLLDAQENIKWQTFNFPTNVLLMGQKLSVATHLTSPFLTNNNTTSFFSFEIHYDKLALYFNSVDNNKNVKYSYWEFQPSPTTNITFIDLSSNGLDLFDPLYRNFSQIVPPVRQQVRFVVLDNDTGNLGFYYYSPYKDKFEASFEVLNDTCDLPLACSPYGICTFSNTCSCIRLLMNYSGDHTSKNDCEDGITKGLCRKDRVEMLELKDASSVVRNPTIMSNVSKNECANSCLNDCECAAALYSSSVGECMFYETVKGVKQVNAGSGLSYLVKVSRASLGKQKKSGLRKWVLVLVVVVDGFILCVVVGGLAYFGIWWTRRRSSNCSSSVTS
ncbi:hypothetical protein RND81_05G015200 [Saponaria officinalis]|uniref:Bulb-type lectin domain-containing protein n=1 Tax=Saponaria officinalis TaxID=3572 RepID=A0AAW1KSU4_SAPOF